MLLSKVLRRVALVLTCLLTAGGTVFALGYAAQDPGGWGAVGLAAAVYAPLVGLTVLAVFRPEWSVLALIGAVVLYAVWGAVAVVFDPVDAPTMPIIAMVLAVPVAVVGQRHPWHAGGLLAAMTAVPLVVILARYFTEPVGQGPGLGSLFGTSTGVVVIPLAVLAVLFLVAGSTHSEQELGQRPPSRPLPPASISR